MQIKRMENRLWLAVLLLVAALSLAGCGMSAGNSGGQLSQEQVDGLEKLGKIKVISREDGSGTRSTFAELAGFAGEGKGADLTREDAAVADNAETVVQQVAGDKAAIGYASYGTVRSAADVKILTVNGFDVASSKGSYALRRSFDLAYSGRRSDVEQDFLTYVTGAGQELVGRFFGAVAMVDRFLSN